MMTPKDHMSQDLSYFSGPSTSGAVDKDGGSGPGPQNARVHPGPLWVVPHPALQPLTMGPQLGPERGQR